MEKIEQDVQRVLSEETSDALGAALNTIVTHWKAERGTLNLRARLPSHLSRAKVEELKPRLEAELSAIGALLEGVQTVDVRWDDALPGRQIASDDPVPHVKHVVVVMSGKGGVGKSTVCTNLALALKRSGYRVGLLDADMYGPSIPTMLGIQGRPHNRGGKITPLQRFGVKLMSLGFLLEDPKSAVVWRGPMLHGALLQFLKDVEWGELDFLLLDLPPGTGDVMLTIAQNLQATGAVVVTTPQDVALQDVHKSVSMAKKVGLRVLGVVENQSYFICGACSEKHFLFGKGGGEKIAEQAEAPLIGQLPIEPSIAQWGDAGTPIVQASPGSAVARQFMSMAETLIDRCSEAVAEQRPMSIDRSGGSSRHLPVMR